MNNFEIFLAANNIFINLTNGRYEFKLTYICGLKLEKLHELNYSKFRNKEVIVNKMINSNLGVRRVLGLYLKNIVFEGKPSVQNFRMNQPERRI